MIESQENWDCVVWEQWHQNYQFCLHRTPSLNPDHHSSFYRGDVKDHHFWHSAGENPREVKGRSDQRFELLYLSYQPTNRSRGRQSITTERKCVSLNSIRMTVLKTFSESPISYLFNFNKSSRVPRHQDTYVNQHTLFTLSGRRVNRSM